SLIETSGVFLQLTITNLTFFLYENYAGIETLSNPLPPLVCVNTTAGTGSEVTRHCVITNTEKKVKFVIVSWRNTPLVSINDPELMVGKPAGLTAATGM